MSPSTQGNPDPREDDGESLNAQLALTWPHRDKRLVYAYDEQGQPLPRFVPLGPLEPRPFIDVDQVGDEAGKAWSEHSNLLIRGDNLHALETLKRYYAGQIKLVYIDPPFRTGAAFAEYDDGLEHSTWLTMMRDRLEILLELLSDDGSIWAEIDDTEFGYLNVLLDEVFGRQNRIATVTVKRSAGTGHKSQNPGPINATDFILGYAKNRGNWTYHPQVVLRDSYDKQYSKWIAGIDGPPENWKLESMADIFAVSQGFPNVKTARKEIGARKFTEQSQRFAIDNAKHVVRLAAPNYEGVSKAAQAMIDRSRLQPDLVHHLPREDFDDFFFLDGQRILFLQNKVGEAEGGGQAGLVEKLTNFWDDVPWQGISGEGSVKFAKNKKPERLLQRIIAMASRPGDLVLDSFAGSGTTGAVAHKMGRRWLMVEMGEHAETLALERMRRVVSGEQTGVSKAVEWKGGGGFRFMTLGQPLLGREPTLGLTVLNPAYSNGLLVSAVCLREGFRPTGDELLHGHGGGGAYAHVTEDFVTADVFDRLKAALPDGGALSVYCLAHADGLGREAGITVLRVPKDLAQRYSTVT